MVKTLVSSYQGSAEYQMSNGVRVEVRTFAYDQHPFKSDVYTHEILPMIGCVYLRYGYQEFPSADIMAAFPGYVAARYVANDQTAPYATRVEYAGSAPRVRHNPRLGAIEADI